MKIQTILSVFVAVTCIGCGGGTGTLTGKVKHKNVYLARGTVTVFNEKGQNQSGEIQSDGSYRIENCPTGPVKITVQTYDAETGAKMKAAAEKGGRFEVPTSTSAAPPPPVEKPPIIPAIYSDPDQTTLTHTVPSGESEHEIDIP